MESVGVDCFLAETCAGDYHQPRHHANVQPPFISAPGFLHFFALIFLTSSGEGVS